eukprot:g2062.t1
MVRPVGKRWGVVAVVAALSAGAGLIGVGATTTTVDNGDLYPECRGVLEHIGDGYCDTYGDDTNNVEECGFDGGDCCICTCVSAAYDCPDSSNNYDCLDTSAECYEEPGPTPSPVAEPQEAETTEDSAAPPRFAGVTSPSAGAAAGAGAFAVTVLCGGFAFAVGW